MDGAQTADNCQFCSEKATRCYTCPRCNARYCSVDCYKSAKHLSCSELFYRDCFMEGLRSMQPDSDERSKLVEMLQRLDMDTGLEEGEPSVDLAERFADVRVEDCSTELIWQRLTDGERAEFERFVSGAQPNTVVEPWKPWWHAVPQTLVEEVGKEFGTSTAIPPVITNVRHIDQLAKSGCSNLVPFSIVNVLYGYAYTARLYNGEHRTMPMESASAMLDISESLDRGVFSDISLVIGGCLSRLDSPEAHGHFVSREYSIGVVDDVCRIVAATDRTPVSLPVAALSDCHRVFHAARREVGRELKRSGSSVCDPNKDRQRYYAVEKKLEYLISWVLSNGHSLLDLLPALELVSCELTSQLAVHLTEKACVEEIMERKKSERKETPLIEEM